MISISLAGAVAAGALSFLSPCVFPLVPGYLSFLTGSAVDGAEPQRGRAIRQAFSFALGFGTIFIALGATASGVGQSLGAHRKWLEVAGGIVVLIFGLHMLGVLRISLLFRDARFHRLPSPKGFFGALLVGAAFGFGWSPCIGPLLGGVLTLAAARETMGEGILLLAAYAGGLAIPFLLAAAALDRFLLLSQRIRPALPWIERSGGLLLAVFGILLLFGKAGWVGRIFSGFESLAL